MALKKYNLSLTLEQLRKVEAACSVYASEWYIKMHDAAGTDLESVNKQLGDEYGQLADLVNEKIKKIRNR